MWRTGKSFGNEFRTRDRATDRLEGDYLRLDLAANAASFGVRAWHATSLDEFAQALRQARAETRSCVIVAEIEKHRVLPGGGCWWDVAPAEVSLEPKTQELRAEYERDKARFQRLHY
jgi:3D-(3,5/4)-trihydroxycyclohexane-1,2-dione acylhydrolase (decyclizing)